MNKDKIFDDLSYDVKMAKEAKHIIDQKIVEWNEAYYGSNNEYKTNVMGYENDIATNEDSDNRNKSKMVTKEIAKQIEWQKPNVTEPFLSSTSPLRVQNMKSSSQGKVVEKWLNNQFTANFDRYEFIEELVDVMQREGTVWIQSYWENKVETQVTTHKNVTYEELLQMEHADAELQQDGTYTISVEQEITQYNRPSAQVVRNEHILPDPAARSVKELRFMAVIKHMTIAEISKLEGVKKKDIKDLDAATQSSETTIGGQSRNVTGLEYGLDDSYQPQDRARQKIRIIEYWGYYDIDNNGTVEPILAYWEDGSDKILSVEKNPMPNKEIPFDRCVYSKRPFSLWGNPLAFYILDNQKVKSGITRGILDNMSLSNNGQKFIQNGTLDYVNWKRMRNGNRNIMVNKPDGIQDGSYNQLPSSIFDLYNVMSKESEDLAGIKAGSPAITGNNINKDEAQGQLTMSQQRMVALVRSVSRGLEGMAHKWVTMAEVFLEDRQIMALFSETEMQDINLFHKVGETKITIQVGTQANNNIKINQLNMLMQQAKALGESMPPKIINGIVADMLELFNKYSESVELREYEPKPSPEQQKMQQLEMQKTELEVAKLQAEIQEIARSGQADSMKTQAEAQYKSSKSEEARASTQGKQVDTALKPAQVESELKERETKASEKPKKKG